MKWYLRADKDGEIESIIKSTQGNLAQSSHPIEIKREGERQILRESQPQELMWTGRLKKKRRIRIITSKREINAGGKDRVDITFEGVPERITEIDVQIGKRTMKVNPHQPLQVSAAAAGVVGVKLKTKGMIADARTIRALPEPAPPPTPGPPVGVP